MTVKRSNKHKVPHRQTQSGIPYRRTNIFFMSHFEAKMLIKEVLLGVSKSKLFDFRSMN